MMIENAHLIHSKQCPVIFLLFNAKLKSVVTSVLFLNELLKAYVNEKAHGPRANYPKSIREVSIQ